MSDMPQAGKMSCMQRVKSYIHGSINYNETIVAPKTQQCQGNCGKDTKLNKTFDKTHVPHDKLVMIYYTTENLRVGSVIY